MRALARLLWAFVERLLPRAASSLLMFLLATLTSPESVGLFAWATILYTGYLAVTDASLRQVSVTAVRSPKGRTFLRSFRQYAGPSGLLVLAFGLFCIGLMSHEDQRPTVMLLAPIILAPLFTAANAEYVARLQLLNAWRDLAIGQGVAAVFSLLVAGPLLLTTHSVLGCSVGVLTTEIVFHLWCKTQANRKKRDLGRILREFDSRTETRSYSVQYVHMAGYAALAWLQAQTDRILIGLWAGTSSLGIFSLGMAVARSVGDALAASNANVLRAELAAARGDSLDTSKAVSRTLYRGLGVGFVSTIAVTILTITLLGPILGKEWEQAVRIVPTLSLVAIPAGLAWSSAVLHVVYGTTRRAALSPGLGVFLAIPTAFVATFSLSAAAVTVVLRECILVAVAFALMGRRAPWPILINATLLTLVLGGTYVWLGVSSIL